MIKRACVYQRNNKFYVSAEDQNNAGFWTINPEVTVVDVHDPDQLHVEVNLALKRSRSNIPIPSRDEKLLANLFKAAKTSSYSAFAKVAKCVDVELQGQTISIMPYRNLGTRKGFEPIVESLLTLPEDSSELGVMVVRAFESALTLQE
jgi:hypothetical protein